MKGLRSIVPLSVGSLRGVEPSKVGRKLPKFEWVDPRKLCVEDAYQRDLGGETNTRLIRRIVGAFSWARFKPPVCVRLPDSGNVLVCIDGQHTATAAATHPDVDKIPVMVVQAEDVAARAHAFVGHNRDRIGLTPLAIHRAEVAAGDANAEAIQRACRKAGASIARKPINRESKENIGATMALGTIKGILKKDGEAVLARVFGVLVEASRFPLLAPEIAAVAEIAREDPSGGLDGKLSKIVASKPSGEWIAEAQMHAVQIGGRLGPALAKLWVARLPAVVLSAKPSVAPIPAAQSKPKAETALTPQGAPQVWFNGVSLDLRARTVTHREATVTVADAEIKLVGALARVMPAVLPADRLAKSVLGSPADAEDRVWTLAQRANPKIANVRLEIRKVAKIGFMLADIRG